MSLNSSAEHERIDRDTTASNPRNRRNLDLSLVVGVVAISVFLVLFVIEFSRILAVTGRVDHVSPVGATHFPTHDQTRDLKSLPSDGPRF